MRNYFILLSLSFVILSCGSENKTAYKEIHNKGNNIVLLLDLSNRIKDQSGITDIKIIDQILDNLLPLFKASWEKGIADRIEIRSVNQNVINNMYLHDDPNLTIDLKLYKDSPNKLSEFLFRPEKANVSFKSEVARIKKELIRIYKEVDVTGADVIDFFNQKLQSPLLINQTTECKSERFKTNYINSYTNKVILITDGYIEANKTGEEKTNYDATNPLLRNYFSEAFINEFRNHYNKSGRSGTIQEFYSREKYGIIPVNNPALKNCELLVIGIEDRSKSNGNNNIKPNDLAIIQLFWTDWLIKSGFHPGKIQLKPVFDTSSDMKSVINKFLGIRG